VARIMTAFRCFVCDSGSRRLLNGVGCWLGFFSGQLR